MYYFLYKVEPTRHNKRNSECLSAYFVSTFLHTYIYSPFYWCVLWIFVISQSEISNGFWFPKKSVSTFKKSDSDFEKTVSAFKKIWFWLSENNFCISKKIELSLNLQKSDNQFKNGLSIKNGFCIKRLMTHSISSIIYLLHPIRAVTVTFLKNLITLLQKWL